MFGNRPREPYGEVDFGLEACARGKGVAFYRTVALVNKLTRLNDGGEPKRFSKPIENLDLLICVDDRAVPIVAARPTVTP